jgi:hypothetical protein
MIVRHGALGSVDIKERNKETYRAGSSGHAICNLFVARPYTYYRVNKLREERLAAIARGARGSDGVVADGALAQSRIRCVGRHRLRCDVCHDRTVELDAFIAASTPFPMPDWDSS